MPGHRVDGDIEAIGAAVNAGTGVDNGFRFGGTATVVQIGNYTMVCDPTGRAAIQLGNATDPANYHDNDFHRFRKRDAETLLADIQPDGLHLHAGSYRIGDDLVLQRNGNYTILYDPNVRAAIWCGNSIDRGNYYDNDGHAFRKRDLTALGSIGDLGVESSGGDFRSPTQRFRSIVSVAALADNGTYVVRSAVGQGGELLVIADVTGRFAAHSSVGPNGSTEYVGGAVNASVFSAVKDTSGKINCYFEAAVGLVVQNKRGVGINFGFIWMGT